MNFTTGTKLGPYEVVQQIGAGGFGQVYKARDSRLNRFVAIKALPEHLSTNSDLKTRFEHEAKTLASLSHPYICPVFDVGTENGTDFIVMEFLEGQTLAERLEKGPLPLGEALKIASQIVDALDKAHRQGFIHRDVKPSNVMLTKTGAKLLDFGLAKLKAGSQHTSLSSLPTRGDMTAEGAVLGTLQYMAPEQLEGMEADARTDIFAFGAVLYEMVTGKKAFEGKSQASLIGSILKDTPRPISELQPIAPRSLDRLVKTCLAKNPDQRWQTAYDLGLELEWLEEGGPDAKTGAVTSGTPKRGRLPWAIAVAASVVAAFVAMPTLRHLRETTPGEMRLEIITPLSSAPLEFALSPDGTRLAFVALDNGTQRLWVRPLNSVGAQALAGTDGASRPFWSPDSRSIGFFATGKLKRIDIDGGSPQTLADSGPGGGTWNQDGIILFGWSAAGALRRVTATGGKTEDATRLGQGQVNHLFPRFLPDGQHFLFHVGSSQGAIYLASLDGREPKRIVASDTDGGWFNRDGCYMSSKGRCVPRHWIFLVARLSEIPFLSQIAWATTQ